MAGPPMFTPVPGVPGAYSPLTPQDEELRSQGPLPPAGPPPPPGSITNAYGQTQVNPTQAPPGSFRDSGAAVDNAEAEQEGNQLLTDLAWPTQGGDPRTGGQGFFPTPYGGWPAMRALSGSYRDAQAGYQEQAQLGAKQAEEQARLQQEESARAFAVAQQEAQQRARERAAYEARIAEVQKQADEIAKTKIDQGRIFRSPAGVLGAIAAGFMSFAGDPYAGIKLINQAVDRDINIQQQDIANRKVGLEVKRGLLADYMQMTRDDQAARMFTEAKMKEVAANKMMEVASRYRAPQILAEAKVKSALLEHDATVTKMNALRQMFKDYQLMTPQMKAALGLEPNLPQGIAEDTFPTKPVEVQGDPANAYWQAEDESGEASPGERADIQAIKGGSPARAYMPEPKSPESLGYSSKTGNTPSASTGASPAVGNLGVMASPKTSNGKELLQRYKHIYRDPTMRARIADLKATLMPRYKAAYGSRAPQKWEEDLLKAANGGVKEITEASKETDTLISAVARARQGLQDIKRLYGDRADEVWGALNSAGLENVAQTLSGLKLAGQKMVGMTPSEEDKLVRRVMSDVMNVRLIKGRRMRKAELDMFHKQFNLAGGIDEVDNLLARTSADANKDLQNARLHAGPVARAYYDAMGRDAMKPRDRRR